MDFSQWDFAEPVEWNFEIPVLEGWDFAEPLQWEWDFAGDAFSA